jgi:hypothetical protein
MQVKHLRNELPPDYLEQLELSGSQLASKLFTERAVFKELVRASEGVARISCHLHDSILRGASERSTKDRKRSCIEGASMVQQDKEGNLDDHLRSVLRKIADEVIGKKHAALSCYS